MGRAEGWSPWEQKSRRGVTRGGRSEGVRKGEQRRTSDTTLSGPIRVLRRGPLGRGGEDRAWRRTDRSGSGAARQRRGSGGLDRPRSAGKAPLLLTAAQSAALAQAVADGPQLILTAWRACEWPICDNRSGARSASSIRRQTLGRELLARGVRKLSSVSTQ